MLKIRRPLGRLIFNMGIAIPGKTVFLIETAPRLCKITSSLCSMSAGQPGEATIVNTLRPRQNGRRFADDTFERIFLNENVRISINISLKFVPRGSIDNIATLVQVMAWRRPGDKPLSEPMMVSLLTHICVTRPQWVKMAQTRQLALRIFCQGTPLWDPWSLWNLQRRNTRACYTSHKNDRHVCFFVVGCTISPEGFVVRRRWRIVGMTA